MAVPGLTDWKSGWVRACETQGVGGGAQPTKHQYSSNVRLTTQSIGGKLVFLNMLLSIFSRYSNIKFKKNLSGDPSLYTFMLSCLKLVKIK